MMTNIACAIVSCLLTNTVTTYEASDGAQCLQQQMDGESCQDWGCDHIQSQPSVRTDTTVIRRRNTLSVPFDGGIHKIISHEVLSITPQRYELYSKWVPATTNAPPNTPPAKVLPKTNK